MATQLTSRSTVLAREAMTLTPGGVHSNVRLPNASVFFERGEGAWLFDVDGNDYVDYLLGQGPNFLGHGDPVVAKAVYDATRSGMVFGAQHPLENEASALFLERIGWAEMMRFSVSGTEADQAAFRLARAYTDRQTIVRFEGHYHGWLDDVLVRVQDHEAATASAGQLPPRPGSFALLPWNDAAALEAYLMANPGTVAAVVMEPVMCNVGAITPREGYLEAVRKLCDRHGALLIFDEVITGFRIDPRGAVGRFGVVPDLATFGKAMAGGWPVAAIAGRADVMGLFADGVNHSGTFNASVMACAAVASTMRQLADDSLYAGVEAHGLALMEGIRSAADRHGIPVHVQGLPAAFHVSFGGEDHIFDLDDLNRQDLAAYARFSQHLSANGLWVAPRGIWYTSAAHGERELDVALERIDRSFATAGPILNFSS